MSAEERQNPEERERRQRGTAAAGRTCTAREPGSNHGRCSGRSASTAGARRAGSTSQECHPVKAAAGGRAEERIPGPDEQVEALGGGGIGGPQALRGAELSITI